MLVKKRERFRRKHHRWSGELIIFRLLLLIGGSWLLITLYAIGPKLARTRSVYVVARSGPGRLGNQLFQYASLWGVVVTAQHETNDVDFHFCMDPSHPFRLLQASFPHLKLPSQCPTESFEERNVLTLFEDGYGRYTEFDLLSECQRRRFFHATCFVNIGTYLQSYKYLQPIRKELSHQLKPASEKEDLALDAIDQIIEERGADTKGHVMLVGVHVRRRDVLATTYLEAAPPSYFAKARQFFQERYGHDPSIQVEFLVVSDDLSWCRQQEEFHGMLFLESNDPMVTFGLLRRCDGFILSVGTFGWWPAFLASTTRTSTTTVYFKDAIVLDDPVNHKQIALEDYYPSDWIGLGAG